MAPALSKPTQAAPKDHSLTNLRTISTDLTILDHMSNSIWRSWLMSTFFHLSSFLTSRRLARKPPREFLLVDDGGYAFLAPRIPLSAHRPSQSSWACVMVKFGLWHRYRLVLCNISRAFEASAACMVQRPPPSLRHCALSLLQPVPKSQYFTQLHTSNDPRNPCQLSDLDPFLIREGLHITLNL
ncbi:hypothetical protein EG329_004302 [Mollisiaceae sp. DMI_Dod_QoI]|nr:hypothetical protein EG329_004302 [Helotiales sp. DMI_Dod_QoI]